MPVIEKRWWFTLTPAPNRASGVLRQAWPTWEIAKEKARELGGVAEEEMIEVSYALEPDRETPGQQRRRALAETGNRSYRYADDKGETAVQTFTAGANSFVERKKRETEIARLAGK